MPSGLFPRSGPRATSSQAEIALYRALAAALPGGWCAWHSLRIRTADNQEGEGDFIVGIPHRGILVIEVKGGTISVVDGQWLQNGVPMEPPRAQALGYARKLIAKLQERGGTGPIPYAVATAFPDTGFSTPPSQGDLEGTVLGAQDLPHLRTALVGMAERLFQGRPAPRDQQWLAALHDLWGETWRPRLHLGDRFRQRRDELVTLDRDQLQLLDLVDLSHRLHVMGGPGTGKTLLAREIHQRFRQDGAQPVLLCFTSALAAGLRAAGVAEAWTVRELAARLLQEAGLPMQGGAPSERWTPETWDLAPLQAAMDAGGLARERFRAVVVDEGQDLTANDWELVRAIAGEDRRLWCFTDGAQGFWPERAIPGGLFPAQFRLTRRYRCPDPLARFADQYRPATTGMPSPPDGPFAELRINRAPAFSALEERVALEIAKALGQGAKPGDIAVLSLAGHTRTEVCSRVRIGAHPVARADAADAAEHVVADTFLRFKGLERPWVIITELGLGENRYDVRMHVALTRATVGCVVVATAPELTADPRLHRLLVPAASTPGRAPA